MLHRRRDGPCFGLLTVSGTWLAAYERPRRPFVSLSGTLSLSTAGAVSDDRDRHLLSAGDLRLGIMVGKTIAGRLVPLLAGRVFGGPVYWRLGGEAVTGTDSHHYAVGGGLIVRLPARLDLFTEVMALGEQSVSVGGTVSF